MKILGIVASAILYSWGMILVGLFLANQPITVKYVDQTPSMLSRVDNAIASGYDAGLFGAAVGCSSKGYFETPNGSVFKCESYDLVENDNTVLGKCDVNRVTSLVKDGKLHEYPCAIVMEFDK